MSKKPKYDDKYSYIRDLDFIMENATDEERAKYAYWVKAQKNNRIDEERKETTYRSYHISVDEVFPPDAPAQLIADDITAMEDAIAHSDVDAWLQMIESPSLLKALRKLKKNDLIFLFGYLSKHQTHEEYAQFLGCSRRAVSKKLKRIYDKLVTLI